MSNNKTPDYSNIHTIGAQQDLVTDWKPREAILEMLRLIDSGEVKAEKVIIIYTTPMTDDNRDPCPGFMIAGKGGTITSLGMLNYTMHRQCGFVVSEDD